MPKKVGGMGLEGGESGVAALQKEDAITSRTAARTYHVSLMRFPPHILTPTRFLPTSPRHRFVSVNEQRKVELKIAKVANSAA
jgi:hypothetical protein